MAKQIAFIDDETTLTNYYLDALRSNGYGCRHFKSPDSCLTAIRSGKVYDLFITDLMMPSYGTYTKAETSDGLKTGSVFTLDLRRIVPEIPVIVITNLNVEPVFADVKSELADCPNVFVVRKAEFTPQILAESIHALLEDGLPLEKRTNVLRRFWDSLLLEPNFFGIGVKIKKLFGEWAE